MYCIANGNRLGNRMEIDILDFVILSNNKHKYANKEKNNTSLLFFSDIF